MSESIPAGPAPASAPKPRLWTANFILALLVNVGSSVGFYFVQPVLTPYMEGLGIALTITGIISGMFSFVALAVRPFTGILSDRISPKLILAFTLPLEAFACILYVAFPQVAGLAVARVFHGVGYSFATTVGMVYGTSFAPRERMGEAIGYMGLGNILGTAIGPSLGLAMGATIGFRYSFLVGCGVIMAGFVCLLLTRPPKKTPEEIAAARAKRTSFRLSNMISVKLLPLAVFDGFYGLSIGLVNAFLAVHVASLGIGGAGVFFTALAVVMLAIRPFIGRFADRHRLPVIVIPCYAMTAVALLLIANVRAVWMFIPIAVLMGCGQGTAMAALQAACIRALPDEQRGVATSTYFVLLDIFQGFGPMAGARLTAAVSIGLLAANYRPMYSLTACVFIAGIFAFALYSAHRTRRGDPL
ncbi:MAG: MFS transporter [Lachnospiraceae bacterium]|nr:MFS transporter [Lachnospiraceae bacterium]